MPTQPRPLTPVDGHPMTAQGLHLKAKGLVHYPIGREGCWTWRPLDLTDEEPCIMLGSSDVCIASTHNHFNFS